jgi:SAM domain (Sterile alpha motif)
MDVAQWLQDLGLPDYAALFREQAIDADVLPSLSEADFEKLGLPLGHRKKLIRQSLPWRPRRPPPQSGGPPKRNVASSR